MLQVCNSPKLEVDRNKWKKAIKALVEAFWKTNLWIQHPSEVKNHQTLLADEGILHNCPEQTTWLHWKVNVCEHLSNCVVAKPPTLWYVSSLWFDLWEDHAFKCSGFGSSQIFWGSEWVQMHRARFFESEVQRRHSKTFTCLGGAFAGLLSCQTMNRLKTFDLMQKQLFPSSLSLSSC